jgi:hypothetical protein
MFGHAHLVTFDRVGDADGRLQRPGPALRVQVVAQHRFQRFVVGAAVLQHGQRLGAGAGLQREARVGAADVAEQPHHSIRRTQSTK